ncbi:glycosyl hydrolase family 18 protein [Streptomyces sp. NRRL B-1347]|uniref:glycosyl hydrolase family 18 protein n=1 Tax=Streptomyces sp. NRRL B-1347 TaxID=1476877 RepID=UPI00068C2779|nr:glycosyl hydrolase family 18 protein [Streptomyces sp. NRRL B-1347]
MTLALLTTLLGALAVTQAPPALAAMHTYKAATFNMQNGNRWDGTVTNAGGNLEADLLDTSDAPDVVALQELGSWAPCVDSRSETRQVRSGRLAGTEDPRYWEVTECSDPFVKARGYDLFFLGIENGNSTRNLGFVVKSELDVSLANDVHVIGRAVDGNGDLVPGNPKPMLGIKVGGDTWFYSVHGANNTDDRGDTANRIAAARADAGLISWTVLGDFNRRAETWGRADLNGAHVVDSGTATYKAPLPTLPTGKNLDYAITSAAPPATYVGVRVNNLYSDHHAVLFETRCRNRNTVARSTTRGEACGKETAAVSMGDSYISGEAGRWAGNANTGPGGDVWGTDRRADCEGGKDCIYGETSYDGGTGCDRSDVAPIKSAALDGIPRERRFNIACSGAETKHITSEKFKNQEPQAEKLAQLAKDYDVKMIVVSIGGNDLGFSKIITDCVWRYWGWPSGGSCNTSSANAELKEKLDKTRGDVVKALEKIRSVMTDAGYERDEYDLVLSTYPNPLPRSEQMKYDVHDGDTDRYSIGGCPFRDTDVDWARDELMPGITSMLRDAAKNAGTSLLNVEDAFAGHELCRKGTKQATSANSRANPVSDADAEWVRWIPFLFDKTQNWLWGSQGAKQEAIHPNAYGQKALGSCLADFARSRVPGQAKTSTCVGTPGQDTDGVGLEHAVRISQYKTNDAIPQEVLQRHTPDSKWVSTGPDDADTGRWYINGDPSALKTGEEPEDDEVLETAIRNRTGQYLQGDGGSSWQWASVTDTPRIWKIKPIGSPGAFFITTDDEKWCLAVEPRSTQWGSLRPCSTSNFLRISWKIEKADIKITPRPQPIHRTGHLKSAKDDLVADVDNAWSEPGTRVKALAPKDHPAQKWRARSTPEGWQIISALDGAPVLAHDTDKHEARLAKDDDGDKDQLWQAEDAGDGWTRLRNGGRCLTAGGEDETLALKDCAADDAGQRWKALGVTPEKPDDEGKDGDAGDPYDDGEPVRDDKPAASGDCRPEGMAKTAGVDTPYCDVYDEQGREWLGNGRSRRVVGYFTGWRTGAKGDPKYLVGNIPWTKVTHINYAFAHVKDDKISVGDTSDPKNPATGMTWPGNPRAEMDDSLPYKGHFNLLTKYKKRHPSVKTLISVGGWAETREFYSMATNADGSVNQGGIDTFADSVVDFLQRYGFDGVDIDYEYPTALPKTGNPKDWDVADPRRKGLTKGYNALMKTLREKLDRAGADKGRYLQLTSAGSSSGYLVRGLDAGKSFQYQDFVNVMSYDLHGSWNKYVGPQAPLYDDGKDNELAAAGVYDDQKADTKDFQKHGYFNTDWAYHYYRGALPAGRINLGLPYYTRGWRDVQGGQDGLWGTSSLPQQGDCPLGTGGRGGHSDCGMGAEGIDNIWHDIEDGKEVAAGSNPLWHAKNLQRGTTPGYLRSYGLDTTQQRNKLRGDYSEKYSSELEAPWLWNADKKVFLSTENERSIDAKAEYVKDNGIGGVMLWELAGDYAERPGGEYGMGYDLTTRLDKAMRAAGPYGATKAGQGRTLPRQVIDADVELVDFPTGKDDFYPLQPKLRITNNSKETLGQGTEISFDIPTSAPPVIKDNDYKVMPIVKPGRSGSNKGGLKADFHRVTIELGYCEDIPPGKSMDIDVKYYLPITGPANTVVKIGDKEFGVTGDQRRGTDTVEPPAPAAGGCPAVDWKPGKTYTPSAGRLWGAFDKGDKGWQFEYQQMNMDYYPDQSRVHLVSPSTTNPNQFWQVKDAGDGWYTIGNSGQCLTATDAGEDLATRDCGDGERQRWRFVPVNDDGTEGSPGGPKHGKLFKLRAATGQEAEAANGDNDHETHILTGDPKRATGAYVKHDGFYWYAQWYTTVEPGRTEADGSRPWKKLGPTP